jgi:hypothetical protein
MLRDRGAPSRTARQWPAPRTRRLASPRSRRGGPPSRARWPSTGRSRGMTTPRRWSSASTAKIPNWTLLSSLVHRPGPPGCRRGHCRPVRRPRRRPAGLAGPRPLEAGRRSAGSARRPGSGAAATRPAGFRRPRTRPCARDLGLLLRRTSVERARPAPAGTGLADPPASSIHKDCTCS